ncbi:MAG: AAA family ATPase [Acidimicrobiales bacterium]
MAVGAPAMEVPFVGRVDELLLLERVLDDAITGHPHLVLLTGDAGVGKSRLLREGVATAVARGVRVLEGACHEGSVIPYLPVATAFRSMAHEGAQRLVPTAEATSAALAHGGPEDHRMRLFLDATSALLASTAAHPTLLVIEDVQWADDATADLIRHLVLSGIHEAEVSSLPLCVLLTARGRWVPDAPHVLARLAREGRGAEVHLERFDRADIHAFVRAVAGARPDSAVTSAVRAASSGNPLLLRGVVERNLGAGTLVVADGVVTLADDRALHAPSDLDDEIRQQLSHADAPTSALLALAAVAGDGVEESTLRAAADADLDVDDAIQRAARLRLVEVDHGHVRFAHPQVRHVVYESIGPTARAAAHLRLADALEATSTAPGRGLAVAHHLLASGLASPGERLARWTLQAGDEAWGTGAWTEALDSYVTALDVGARTALEPRELAQVLLRTGVAAYYANDDSCPRWLEEAATAAAAQGDLAGEAEALLLRARFQLIATAAAVGAKPPITELERLLPALAEPALRARLHATISDLYVVALDHDGAARHAALAEAELAAVGDDDSATTSQVHVVLGLREMTALELPAARRHLEIARQTGDEHRQMAAATRIGLCQLVEGDLDEAHRTLGEARRGERSLASHAGQQLPAAGLAAIAVLQGRLAEAERLCGEVEALYDIQEYAFTPGLVYPALAASRAAAGDRVGAEDALRRWRGCGGRGTWRYEAYLAVMAGDLDSLRDDLHERGWRPPGSATFFTLDIPCVHVLIGVALGDDDLVRSALSPLVEAHAHGAVVSVGWPWLLSRVIADGHQHLGDEAAAERWYQVADAEATRAGARLERDLVRLGRGRLALARGRTREAADLGTEAAAGLDAVGALQLASHAHDLITRTGVDAVTVSARERYILFTDIVGSTALNVRAGDERYHTLLREHDRLIRARLHRHGGVEQSHTGDGLTAWFSSADDALACGLGIFADLERASVSHPDLPVRSRIGIAAGRPVHDGERLFGLVMAEAARVCAQADADQLLVTRPVRDSAGSGWTFRSVGERLLKGLPDPRELFAAAGGADR